MSENRISICVIGGTQANLDKLSEIIDTSELSTVYFFVKSEDSLLEMIDQDHCHLVIGNPGSRGFNIFDAVKVIANIDTHIPVIGVYESTKLTVVDAMEKGLSDFVELSNHKHLHPVVDRKWHGCHLL